MIRSANQPTGAGAGNVPPIRGLGEGVIVQQQVRIHSWLTLHDVRIRSGG